MKNINLNGITKTVGGMNKTWRIVGLIALAAGALYYPAMQLYKYAKTRRNAMNEDASEEGQTKSKVFSPAYRGSHKPHHRKAASNGHLSNGHLS